MSSNSTSITSLKLSIDDLIERNSVPGINAGLSLLGILANITVFFLICNNPPLRKNCKYLQAALAAGDAVLCLGQLINSSISLVTVNLSIRYPRWVCLLLTSPSGISIMYSMVMTVFIALDRFYAVTKPMKYRNLPKFRICLQCVLIAVIISLAFTIATYMDVNLFDYPQECNGASSRSPRLSGLISNFITAAGILVLIVYPSTLVVMRYKLRKLIGISDQDKQSFMKQVEVTASITLVVMASLILYVIPNLFVIILKSCGALQVVTSKAPAYIGLGSTVHSGINCVFYLWKDMGMRKAFLKFLKG